MLCPTDSFNRQPFMGSSGSATGSFGDNWARGNYAANGSLGFPYPSLGSPVSGVPDLGAGGPNAPDGEIRISAA